MRYLTTVIIAAAFLFGGCGGSASMSGDEYAPDWELNPGNYKESKFTVIGSGSAKKQSRELAKKTADHRAKVAVVSKLQTKVSGLVKDFLSEAGEGGEGETAELSQSITKEVFSKTLEGVEIVKREYKNGTFYVLAKYEFDPRKTAELLKHQNAMKSRLEAQKGFEGLEKELQNVDFSQ